MNEKKEKKEPRWLEKFKDQDNRHGLGFVGFENGVPKWRGGWKNGPPLWFCRMFLAFGITLLTAGILTGLFASGNASEATTALYLTGTTHSIVSAIMFRWRRNYEAQMPVEKICERLGVDAETVRQIAVEKDIKPRSIINEQPMYNLHDFGDVGTLLRASEAPVSADTLLRAVDSAPSSTPQEELLRASSAEPTGKKAAAKTTAQTEEKEETAHVVLGAGRSE